MKILEISKAMTKKSLQSGCKALSTSSHLQCLIKCSPAGRLLAVEKFTIFLAGQDSFNIVFPLISAGSQTRVAL